MFVNGLAVTCRSGWLHSASCLSTGRISSSSTALVTAAAREKGALGRTMQQWRVVGIRLRGGKTSMMGLQLIC